MTETHRRIIAIAETLGMEITKHPRRENIDAVGMLEFIHARVRKLIAVGPDEFKALEQRRELGELRARAGWPELPPIQQAANAALEPMTLLSPENVREYVEAKLREPRTSQVLVGIEGV